MGVKSTVTLNRHEAINKYVDLRLKRINVERMLEAEATAMTDKQLEDVLERLNDAANGGEGYENYIIGDSTWSSE